MKMGTIDIVPRYQVVTWYWEGRDQNGGDQKCLVQQTVAAQL